MAEPTRGSTTAPVSGDDESDGVTAIRALVGAAQEHQNDPEPFLELHTPDVAIVNIAGRRVLGRDALRAAMEGALAGSLARVLTRTDVEDVRFLRPDVALVSCVKHVDDRREDPDGDELPAAGSLTYVVVRDPAGAWRIASAQTTPRLG